MGPAFSYDGLYGYDRPNRLTYGYDYDQLDRQTSTGSS